MAAPPRFCCQNVSSARETQRRKELDGGDDFSDWRAFQQEQLGEDLRRAQQRKKRGGLCRWYTFF